jgi:hypothetical protein
VGAIDDVVVAEGVTTVEVMGVAVPIMRGVGAVSVAAVLAAVPVWFFNSVPKSVVEAGSPVLAGISDLRCIAGGI